MGEPGPVLGAGAGTLLAVEAGAAGCLAAGAVVAAFGWGVPERGEGEVGVESREMPKDEESPGEAVGALAGFGVWLVVGGPLLGAGLAAGFEIGMSMLPSSSSSNMESSAENVTDVPDCCF